MYRRLTNPQYPYLYPTPVEGLNVRIFVSPMDTKKLQ